MSASPATAALAEVAATFNLGPHNHGYGEPGGQAMERLLADLGFMVVSEADLRAVFELALPEDAVDAAFDLATERLRELQQ